MKDIISIVRLLGSVGEYSPEQKDEATLLQKAILRGDTDLQIFVSIKGGEVKDVMLGEVEYHPFERKNKKKGDE